MKAYVKLNKTTCLTLTAVKCVHALTNALEICFNSETDSFKAFQQLKDKNIRCSHAGKNAPCGPMIMLFGPYGSGYSFEFV